MNRSAVFVRIALACLLLVLAGCAAPAKSPRETPVVQVVRDNAASVVNIRTESLVDLKEHPAWGQYGERLDRFFRQYFGEDYSEGTVRLKSVGSGVIVDRDGLIVTNAHVVHRATTIYAVLRDGTVAEAKVVRVNTLDDLALIRIRPAVSFGPCGLPMSRPHGRRDRRRDRKSPGPRELRDDRRDQRHRPGLQEHGVRLRLLGASADRRLHQPGETAAGRF
jgi:hypothetical protein